MTNWFLEHKQTNFDKPLGADVQYSCQLQANVIYFQIKIDEVYLPMNQSINMSLFD